MQPDFFFFFSLFPRLNEMPVSARPRSGVGEDRAGGSPAPADTPGLSPLVRCAALSSGKNYPNLRLLQLSRFLQLRKGIGEERGKGQFCMESSFSLSFFFPLSLSLFFFPFVLLFCPFYYYYFSSLLLLLPPPFCARSQPKLGGKWAFPRGQEGASSTGR